MTSRTRIDRRVILAGLLGTATTVFGAAPAAAQTARTRLILLGTGGGPRPRKVSSAPAQVIAIGNTAYVIDCGDGVARQLVSANVPLATVRKTLVLSHLVPADDPTVTDSMWADAARMHFRGTVVVGKDLMEI
jgi:ribonuclease BN (tRNA processing enzyme)